MPDLFYTEKIS